MNFLSHFYFDRENPNAYEVLGTVLPDLIKNAAKSWVIHPEKKEHLFLENKNHKALLKGWRRHIEVDRLFHGSTFFLHHQHQIKLVIRETIAGSPVKPFFLGHISLELMLDSLLITEGLIDPNQFYEIIEQVNEVDLKSFLLLNRIEDTDRFFHFFERFKKEKYLFSYSNPEKITYALKQICMRLWQDPFTVDQQDALTKSLLVYKGRLAEEFISIFEMIDAQLN
ncbi:MAG: hypothetical protein ABIP95_01870 [Pelobium sp.]